MSSPDDIQHKEDSEEIHKEKIYSSNTNSNSNKYEIKQSTSKTNKAPQKVTSKKISKTSNKTSSIKTVSYKTIKKETTNIDSDNAPNKNQIKKLENIEKEGMNYRADIFKTKENLKKLEKDLEEKHIKLEKVNKEKENLKIYLGKLEKIVQNKTDTDNTPFSIAPKASKKSNSIKTDNLMTYNSNNKQTEESQNMTEQSEDKMNDDVKLTISMTGASPVITMDDGKGNKNIIKSKKGLMKFLYKIYMENQNLKNFQKQVFDLSKNYDDINNIMEEGIYGFQEIAKNTKNQKIQSLVDEKLKELKSEVDTSLKQKQEEYNMQLKKKEEEINMLEKAYDNIYKEVQQKNTDKIHEQKTIKDLNSQIEILETKLAYLKGNH